MKQESEENLEEEITLTITEEQTLKYYRLDQLLCDILFQKSRSFVKNLFQKNLIESNIKLSLSKIPPTGTIIKIQIPPPVPISAQPEDLPLNILYEDNDLIIVDKKAGMVTHPAPGNYTGTLVNAILFHCKNLTGINGNLRPGIVHRLDKGTSGVMVVAKSELAVTGLISQFSDHSIHRKYEALSIGKPKELSGKIETMIARNPKNRLKMSSKVTKGKSAITHYKVLAYYDQYTHLELKLETGRTHQIRVHLSEFLQIPILCDSTYGNIPRQLKNFKDKNLINIIKDYPHPFLHAKELGFVHPITKKEVFFSSNPPAEFSSLIK